MKQYISSVFEAWWFLTLFLEAPNCAHLIQLMSFLEETLEMCVSVETESKTDSSDT